MWVRAAQLGAVRQQLGATSVSVQPSLCAMCGLPAPTKYVEFYENIGALVMRFHRSAKGNLCKPCIDRTFWDFTGKTILLGWFGVISFMLTPLTLLNNLVRFMTTLGMQRPVIQLARGPSPLWVFSTIVGIGGLGLLTLLLFLDVLLEGVAPTATRPEPPSRQAESCAVVVVGFDTYMILEGDGAFAACQAAIDEDPTGFRPYRQPPRSPVVCRDVLEGIRVTVVDTSETGTGGNIMCTSLYNVLDE